MDTTNSAAWLNNNNNGHTILPFIGERDTLNTVLEILRILFVGRIYLEKLTGA
jgi:hypothetical protein